MTTRKNRIICPWCGAEKPRELCDEFGWLAYQYPPGHVETTCDECGKRYEVRAKECVYYKTKKVGE